MVAEHACPTLVSLEVLQAYVSIVGWDRATPMHQTKVTAGQVWLCGLNVIRCLSNNEFRKRRALSSILATLRMVGPSAF